jgi:hypothetical protein
VPPIDKRRRRRRRISRAGALLLVGAAAVALVVAVLIGGALRAPSQSVGYERAVDRSYAAQARLFVAEANRLGRELHAVVAAMPGDARVTLEEALDTLVRSTTSVAREAATAASPAPSAGAGQDVAEAMADRADAALTLRVAVDRLLGMTPLPVVGTLDPSTSTAPPRPLSAAGAAAELAKVGALLARSDHLYAAGRHALRGAPGHAWLPASVWSGRTAAWTSAGALATVDALTTSPTLAALHQIALVTHALSLTPAPVPSPGGGPSIIPPTGHLGVAVVVANDGNVAERGIVVRATVQRAGSTTRPMASRRVALAPGSSDSVTLPPIPVVPGNSYTVTVTVSPPVPDVAGTPTSATVSVRVAPPGPPTVGQLLPQKGPERGGTDVTILGSGFTWVSGVTFGAKAAVRFKVISSSQITAIAPPGTGTVAVHVTNPGGVSAASSADGFHYRRR